MILLIRSWGYDGPQQLAVVALHMNMHALLARFKTTEEALHAQSDSKPKAGPLICAGRWRRELGHKLS